ncbi:MAG: YegP family protein [Flavobacteriaceae bacterium]
MGKFEIKKDKAGKFRFNLKAANGLVILTSEAYNTKASCDNGIASVKKNCGSEKCYDINVAKNGKPYFNLKSTNGKVIGTSQMYASRSSMNKGIASVKNNAPKAPVVEI